MNHEKLNRDVLQHLECFLDKNLPVAPSTLADAMRYAVLSGGKRVRALLVYDTGLMFGIPQDTLTRLAASVECVHAFSLIHDDLPCMDNDDFRRGKPSCHKAYGEAIALLAGGALHSVAFEWLAQDNVNGSKMVSLLARSIGSFGMVGGQSIDILNVGHFMSKSSLEEMHLMKTGALIQASVLLPTLLVELSESTLEKLTYFSRTLGLLFQVVDDILDVSCSSSVLGKTSGKDEKNNKPTYVALMGLDEAKDYAYNLANSAIESLHQISFDGSALEHMTQKIVHQLN
jgi:farnesyl diphosphate synthase